jgi:thiamine kinase-like enzyme
MPPMDLLIDYIFEKYKDRTLFVNHGDIQFQNFIYNNDINIIDWECANISPFFTDLFSLINHASEVDADINEIKRRYCQFSQMSSIDDEDIQIADIIKNIDEIYGVLVFDCPIEWADNSYNRLLHFIQNFKFH